MTQRKSAIAFAQEQSLKRGKRRGCLAMLRSLVELLFWALHLVIRFFLYAKRYPLGHLLSSKEFRLCYLRPTNDSTVTRPCRTYPVVSFKVIKLVRIDIYFTAGVMFQHLDERQTSKSPYLPFWSQPFRNNLAVLKNNVI